MMLTVGTADPAPPVEDDNTGLTDNMEIRQEMIQLINQTRKANGVSELPVSEALMNAAQVCSSRRCTWRHSPEESKAAVDAGCPYGFGDNLTVFTGTADAVPNTPSTTGSIQFPLLIETKTKTAPTRRFLTPARRT